MATSGAKITNLHVIFPTTEKAEEVAETLREAADEGETFEVIANPVSGKTTAIIAHYFGGIFEGYF